MVGFRKCAVKGCKNTHSTRHRFPNPKKEMKRFEKWVEACANPTLTCLEPNLIYRSHRVCHIHFRPADKSTNMYLQKGEKVVPMLHLPLHTLQADVDAQISSVTHEATTKETVFEKQDLLLPSTSEERSFALDQPSTSTSENFMSTSPMEMELKTPIMDEQSLLKCVGVSRQKYLSPKAKKLYKKAKNLKKIVFSLKKKHNILKRHSLTKCEMIEMVTADMDKSVANFVKSQINLVNVHPKGRRFTLDDKIMGLVLQKQSAKCYRTFSKMFAMPSRKTLSTLLKRIPIGPGINNIIFDNLKLHADKLGPTDRLCILIFDEMSLQPSLTCNRHSKQFEGLEDMGDKRTNVIADHAQVFMLKGVAKHWKQPIAYSFCKNSTKTIDLVRNLKTIVTACFNAGLNVVATVSDQGCTNVAAINYLVKTTMTDATYNRDLKIYEIYNHKLVHIYDPPHLLKGIRNNLLTKDLHWEMGEGKKVCAKWSHIQQAYEMDNTSGKFRILHKLTDYHVIPSKLASKKMRVAYAAQVFSHSMASLIYLFTKKGVAVNNMKLEETATGTAEIISFFDTLFDSVNGTTLYPQGGKKMKCVISHNSGHIHFWREARKNLSNMFFIKEGKTGKYTPPSLLHWRSTLAGLEELFHIINKNGLTFFKPRNVNQDAVENFFGQMRQHGGRNINPTPTNFKQYFKTLLINNLVTRHSLSANCEDDEATNIIKEVKLFVTQNIEKDIGQDPINLTIYNIPPCNYSYVDNISIGYICGFLTKKIKTINTCDICKSNMLTNRLENWHDLIVQKEYLSDIPKKLKYCSPNFLEYICKCNNIVLTLLPKICHLRHCLSHLIVYLQENVQSNFAVCCHTLDVEKFITEYFTIFCANNWADGFNRQLRGKDNRKNLQDEMYIQAREYFVKRKK